MYTKELLAHLAEKEEKALNKGVKTGKKKGPRTMLQEAGVIKTFEPDEGLRSSFAK